METRPRGGLRVALFSCQALRWGIILTICNQSAKTAPFRHSAFRAGVFLIPAGNPLKPGIFCPVFARKSAEISARTKFRTILYGFLYGHFCTFPHDFPRFPQFFIEKKELYGDSTI